MAVMTMKMLKMMGGMAQGLGDDKGVRQGDYYNDRVDI